MKIAIAGLGTVGDEVALWLQEQGAEYGLELVAVSARSKDKKRKADIHALDWYEDAEKLVELDIDIIIELIGGETGIAENLIEKALQNGKHVITANKALLAQKGVVLAKLAEKNNLFLGYEAAIAGGIPIVKILKEGLRSNQIYRICGVLNGTCNYILSQMEKHGGELLPSVAKAQELGYAEEDPSFDIGGMDSAHKLALLSALSFGVRPSIKDIHIEGIEAVEPIDISLANRLGFSIRLLGMAQKEEGGISQIVEPVLVPKNSSLGKIEGASNGILIEGDMIGELFLQGPGAGGRETASAVLSDLLDCVSVGKTNAFGVAAEKLVPFTASLASEQRWYIRLSLADEPGSMAKLTAELAKHNISIEEILQSPEEEEKGFLPVVIITHEAPRSHVTDALQHIEKNNHSVLWPVFHSKEQI
ncbi:MAG: homoserine dehydrogenase [Parvibaculales bacterium]